MRQRCCLILHQVLLGTILLNLLPLAQSRASVGVPPKRRCCPQAAVRREHHAPPHETKTQQSRAPKPCPAFRVCSATRVFERSASATASRNRNFPHVPKKILHITALNCLEADIAGLDLIQLSLRTNGIRVPMAACLAWTTASEHRAIKTLLFYNGVEGTTCLRTKTNQTAVRRKSRRASIARLTVRAELPLRRLKVCSTCLMPHISDFRPNSTRSSSESSGGGRPQDDSRCATPDTGSLTRQVSICKTDQSVISERPRSRKAIKGSGIQAQDRAANAKPPCSTSPLRQKHAAHSCARGIYPASAPFCD